MSEKDRDQVLDEAIAEITRVARGHVAAKRGHMTWAEANNVLRKMKSRKEKESPDDPHHTDAHPRASEESHSQADGVVRAHSD